MSSPAAPPPIPLAAARERIAVALLGRRTPVERVDAGSSGGRVLADELRAGFAQPGLDCSAMDGYAVRSAELEAGGGHTLRLAGKSLAGGGTPTPLAAGMAIRITTGAPLPEGADAVVIQEQCAVADSQIHFDGPISAGANVRRAGEDFAVGSRVLPADRIIGPVERGLLAALGQGEVRVRARPRVAIVSTGDELVAPAAARRADQVFDSNAPMLAALALRCGAQVLPLKHAPDDAESLRETLRRQAAAADLLITAGGASVGDKDLLPGLLAEHGVVHFHRIRLRPGMPCLFGELEGCPVLSLPGNPVSAFISFLLLGRFALRLLLGLDPADPPALPVRLAEPLRKKHDRLELQRCQLAVNGEHLVATPHKAQGSHLLAGLGAADGLLELPEGPLQWPAGHPARAWRLHDWWSL